MTDDDSLDATEGVNAIDCRLVKVRDEIPKNVASGSEQEFCSVADGELGFGADGPDFWVVLVLPEDVVSRAAQFEEGGEDLAGCWNVLAGILVG
jgi:hypothetical protein